MILDEGFNEDSNFNLVEASKGKRIANYLIDGIIAQFIGSALSLVMGMQVDTGFNLIANLSGIGFYLLYYIMFEHLNNGRTIGKMVTRTKVVTETGETPTVEALIGRTFARIIPFDALSFLGARNNGWHDRLSHTLVVDLDKSTLPFNETV